MQFSDTSTKQGLLQDCETRTNLGDGIISGDAALKATFTRLMNIRYARTVAKIQLLSGKDGAEDTNYNTQQFSTFAINSGQNDYQFLTDADGNTITDITGVLILPSATATDYEPLERLALSDSEALLIMSPNASNTGTPSGFIEKNNTVFLDTIPNYSHATGGKLFYRLVPSYFAASDTTKRPGFVEAFHALLSIGASYDWLCINKPESSVLIALCASDLKDMTGDLEQYITMKNPTRTIMTGAKHSSR